MRLLKAQVAVCLKLLLQEAMLHVCTPPEIETIDVRSRMVVFQAAAPSMTYLHLQLVEI
jgi:hypothetical protein